MKSIHELKVVYELSVFKNVEQKFEDCLLVIEMAAKAGKSEIQLINLTDDDFDALVIQKLEEFGLKIKREHHWAGDEPPSFTASGWA